MPNLNNSTDYSYSMMDLAKICDSIRIRGDKVEHIKCPKCDGNLKFQASSDWVGSLCAIGYASIKCQCGASYYKTTKI